MRWLQSAYWRTRFFRTSKESQMKHDLSPIKTEAHIAKMREWFGRFAGQTQDSKMYAGLSQKISQDPDLLQMIPDRGTQPVPNLFLASVNYLLAKNLDHELAQFYPNYSSTKFDEDMYPAFRNFCLTKTAEIDQLMETRLVQTNEVRRCALLLPAAAVISEKTQAAHLHLIDVGASSGLNLLMDQYLIRYSDGSVLGNKGSLVDFDCEARGKPLGNLRTPTIATRSGIDLNPINLADEDEFRWALALIWPDQLERIDRFKKAAMVLQKHQVNLKKGSGLDQLGHTLENLPSDGVACVMHSFTLNQFSQAERTHFERRLAQASDKRDVWRIFLEWLGAETPELALEHYAKGGKLTSERLATCHQHGAWIRWEIG